MGSSESELREMDPDHDGRPTSGSSKPRSSAEVPSPLQVPSEHSGAASPPFVRDESSDADHSRSGSPQPDLLSTPKLVWNMGTNLFSLVSGGANRVPFTYENEPSLPGHACALANAGHLSCSAQQSSPPPSPPAGRSAVDPLALPPAQNCAQPNGAQRPTKTALSSTDAAGRDAGRSPHFAGVPPLLKESSHKGSNSKGGSNPTTSGAPSSPPKRAYTTPSGHRPTSHDDVGRMWSVRRSLTVRAPAAARAAVRGWASGPTATRTRAPPGLYRTSAFFVNWNHKHSEAMLAERLTESILRHIGGAAERAKIESIENIVTMHLTQVEVALNKRLQSTHTEHAEQLALLQHHQIVLHHQMNRLLEQAGLDPGSPLLESPGSRAHSPMSPRGARRSSSRHSFTSGLPPRPRSRSPTTMSAIERAANRGNRPRIRAPTGTGTGAASADQSPLAA